MSQSVIEYGKWTFSGTEIKSGRINTTISLLHSELNPNYFETEVECADPEILSFQRNTPIKYYNGGALIGIFYVQSIKRASATSYKIKADSAISLLNDRQHYGGIYAGDTLQTILAGLISGVPYIIKSNLQGVKLYGWLPIATQKDNLAQVLFAVGATIKSDLDGILHIEGLWDGVSGSASKDKMYEGPSVDYASLVTGVSVTEHQYFTGGESVTLFEGTTTAGDIITFSDPMYNLEATGFTILESNANYAKVSVGSGTLTGNKYIHNTREVTASVSSSSSQNVKTVKDATLVSLVNSRAVADRLANYYKCIQEINADVVYGGEKPGDILSTWHPYDMKNVPSCVKSVDVTVSNTLKASEKSLVGFSPEQLKDMITYDKHLVLTGSGTWTVPDGAVSATIVLIDGGQDGQSGSEGTNGTVPSNSSDSENKNFSNVPPDSRQTTSVSATTSGSGSAGKGGNGGKGGAGGRIYQTEISLTPGDEIAYSCGAVVAYGGSSETKFGTHSSVSGSRNPYGYTDIVTGTVYAKSGTDGIKGGDGGSSGSSGEDAGTAKGGNPGSYSPGNLQDSSTIRGPNGETNIATGATASFRFGNAGGGGAGGNGEAGGDASLSNRPEISVSTISAGYVSATGYAIAGGNGGNGGNGGDASQYGCGGDGGHGGGGTGASGTLTTQVDAYVYWYNRSSTGTTTSLDLNLSVSAYVRSSPAPTRGAGGSGGAGQAGCIIIYYRQNEQSKTGQVVDKNNKMLLDRLGRRVIV